jgi:chromate reductase
MVANTLAELAPTSLVLGDVEIGDLPLYNQDLDIERRPAKEWVAFRDRVRGMDAVLFVTPEYNRSVPGVLKNAIDVGSRPYGHSVWSGKPAGIVSSSPGVYGGFGANHHLRQSLVFLDMPAMQQPEAYLSQIDKSFDGDGKLISSETRDLLTSFLSAFERWLDTHAARAAQSARKSA